MNRPNIINLIIEDLDDQTSNILEGYIEKLEQDCALLDQTQVLLNLIQEDNKTLQRAVIDYEKRLGI